MLVNSGKFLECALAQEGKWYIWDSKGPAFFDCSGLVTFAVKLAGGPDFRANYNSQKLWNELEPLDMVQPGQVALALYGADEHHVEHVMVVTGDGRVFGACGGRKSTTTLDEAKALNARVQYRPNAHYRSDFLGYRMLSLRQPQGDANA